MRRLRSVGVVLLLALVPAGLVWGHGFPIDGRLSGSWFDPDRDGEGWVIQVLPDGRAFVTWFTYPEAGNGEDQYLLAGVGDVVEGEIVIDDVVSVRGARFGEAFDPAAVDRSPWGSLRIGFDTCDQGEVAFAGPPAFGSGEYRIRRITSIRGAECDGVPLPGVRSLASRVGAGAWFQYSRDGEGWLIEDLGEGRALVYWFTFSPDGAPAWLIGVGDFADDGLWVDEMLITRGTTFGDGFDPDAVERSPWGSMHFSFFDCGAGRATYRAIDPAFGEGMIDMERLTSIDGIDCEPFPDRALDDGRWSALAAPMPTPRSEFAVAMADGIAYVVGGFGGFGRMEAFDPATGEWTRYSTLPRGRNHHFAVGYRHEIYVFGCFVGEFFSPFERSAYAFNPETDSWRRLADLPLEKASGYNAVTLGDRIYLVGGDPGRSVVYDPQNDSYQTFSAPPGPTDHSQALAYRGELWVMGGRGLADGESETVSIYDPFSRRCRAGPSISVGRGGFGAAIVAGQPMIVGGEVLVDGRRTLTSLEVLDPLTNSWVAGPEMPERLHGLGAVGIDGVLYTFGGTISPGGVDPAGLDFSYRVDNLRR